VTKLVHSGLILLYAASNGSYSVANAERYAYLRGWYLLISLREANRCIRILENISLRGGFWPGACAAAIRDLQLALQKKVENDKSGIPVGNIPRLGEISRPLSGLSQGDPPRQYPHVRPSSSVVNPLPGPTSGTSMDNLQPRNLTTMPGSVPQPDLDTPDHRASSSRIRAATPSQNAVAFNYAWPEIDGGSLEIDDQFNGFDDIFQLIDVPFHLNEYGGQTIW